ncbi:glycoside hydrolase family 2 TIM barrel-domain containing protein [Actinomadura sp. 6N118]
MRTRVLLSALMITLAAILVPCGESVLADSAGAASAGQGGSAPRKEVSLDRGWRFHLGDVPDAEKPGYDDTGWGRVTLPHTWNATDGEDGGDYHRGAGWYRTRVPIPASAAGRRVFLQFDGANLVTDVWVDGRRAGRHEGGYAAFRFDVTELLVPGRTALVAVRVDNSNNPGVPPLMGDFTMFGGLHRGVRMLVTAPVHVDALDHGGPGVYVRQTGVGRARADLAVTTRVTNDTGTARRAQVRTVVTDAAGRPVATMSATAEIPAGRTLPVIQHATIDRPRLWDGRADPYLYQVRADVTAGGTGDRVEIPLGIRTVAVDPARGFLLNGRPYPLNGVNLHAMRRGKGYAISDADVDADVAMIEELGATAIRLAHYQHPQRVYELADRRGLALWTEIPLLGAVTDSDAFRASTARQTLELIRQNQHHPAVVVWGGGNEIYNPNAAANRVLSEVAALIKAVEPERPSTYASCCFSDTDPLTGHTDTIGYNRYFGWYDGAPADIGRWADGLHAQDPGRRISVSEYGAGASVVHHQNPPVKPDPPGEFHPEQWQAAYHEENWRQLRARPYLWGRFIWLMFDFASDGRDEGERPGLNDKGLVTADRKIRKDAFSWYQANWSSKPVVHITSRRDTPRFTGTTDVRVYANTGAVELTVNGERLGRRTPDDHVATWTGVRLRPGANTVIASGGGRTDRVTWWRDAGGARTEVHVDAGTGRPAPGYAADRNASDGVTGRIRTPIAAPYRTHRKGTFAYRLPVANGTYHVDLKFAAPAGAGIFNVNAERRRMIAGLDVAAVAGADAPLDRRVTVEVTDGVLDLEFVPRLGDATVSAITAIRSAEGR